MLKFNRRHYIVNKGFQNKFILHFVIITVIACAFFIICNFFLLKNLEKAIYMNFFSGIRQDEFFIKGLLYNLIILLILIASIAVSMMMLVKKITNPVEVLNNEIKRISEGSLNQMVYLDKDDEFQDIAGELNIMTRVFRDKFYILKSHQMTLYRLVNNLNSIEGMKTVNKIDLITAVDRVLEKIAFFKRTQG